MSQTIIPLSSALYLFDRRRILSFDKSRIHALLIYLKGYLLKDKSMLVSPRALAKPISAKSAYNLMHLPDEEQLKSDALAR